MPDEVHSPPDPLPQDLREPLLEDLPGWPRAPDAYEMLAEETPAERLESLLIEQQQARVLRNAALGP